VESEKESQMISNTINALFEMLRIINDSVPLLLEGVSPVKNLDGQVKEVAGLVNLTFEQAGKEKSIVINEYDRKRFIEDLRLLDLTVKKVNRPEKGVVFKEFKKPSMYAKISNKFFSNFSNKLVEKGSFSSVNKYLRKANLPFIINTYVSIIFFTTFLAAIFSVLLFIILIFFKISAEIPFFIPEAITLERLFYNFLICLAIPIATFFAAYFYPYTEMQSIGKKIDQELPFVVIHMSAVAGSGIEPTQIFKIIALGREYPYMKQEIRKFMNQVNFFGYDLVSALRNSAKTAPSAKLSELFNGLATTISSGGSLIEFLDKRAESLLIDYKIEREKSTKMAESFMDIYISVVIAAPMIMMLLMILMSTKMVSIGLSIEAITFIIISVVALVNVIFLVFLHLKQPTY
jgi:flagellar protein FlaJ